MTGRRGCCKLSNGQCDIRRATPADSESVLQLTREAYAKWVPLIGREPLPMTVDYGVAVREHLIDLAERNGELLGLVEMIVNPGWLLIENIAVRPDQQGKGLGDLLLRHAQNAATSLGLHELRLYTNALFAANIAFYAKRGFIEYHRGSIVPGSETVYMRRVHRG